MTYGDRGGGFTAFGDYDNGAPSLAAPRLYQCCMTLRVLAHVTCDADGNLDIAFVSQYLLFVYRNQGPGSSPGFKYVAEYSRDKITSGGVTRSQLTSVSFVDYDLE